MRTMLKVLFLLILAVPVLAGEFQKSFDFDNDELQIRNMIGAIEVRPTGGDRIKVTVNVRGDDADEDLITFDTEGGAEKTFSINFPIDDHQKYVYPALGKESKTTIRYREQEGGSWLRRVFGGGEKITVRGKGAGLDLWADVLVEVPADREVEVRLGVGTIDAHDVVSDLVLDTHSGSINARDIEGSLLCDTGSGAVAVRGIRGALNVDTGSGSVDLEGCEGPTVLVDTGSGRVTAKAVICQKLTIDTGSGSVEATNVETDHANIDTGSGSVLLQLDRMGDGRFIIDTGSGSITLDVPEDASARIMADTGSGGMHLDLQGAMVEHKSRDEMKLIIGDGDAKVTLDAGSGSITVK